MGNKVGIIYSPGFGAGWSTWGDPEMALDQLMAQAIDAGEPYDKLEEMARDKWPDAYLGGLEDCVVEWVSSGTAFRIDEYDGNEKLVLSDDWQVAK